MVTGFLTDPLFLEHDPGRAHPESAERVRRTLDHLGKLPWFGRLKTLKARPAAIEDILRIHAREYVERAREACREGAPILDTPDVGISSRSFDAAMLAAGAALELGDRVVAGDVSNAFALLRPPGHHAENGFAMGFCLFNNVAILARHLQKRHGLDKILILDWDAHHGNGTQHAFEEDPSVFYMSLHQYPFYPGTGSVWETGRGRGEGYTLNCPMRAGSSDADYEKAFIEKILPRAEMFRPDAVLISAGFDAHADDPLAGLGLSSSFFGWMTERAMEIAGRHAHGRIVSLLEGGYNLTALPESIAIHLAALSGLSSTAETPSR